MEDIQLLKDLEELMEAQRLPILIQEDKVVWDIISSGHFTIKSTYKIIFCKDLCPTTWQKVWINNLLPKINFFWWTVQHGKLLLLDNLKKENFFITNRCYLYKEKEENISHRFLECLYTLKIWSLMWEKFGLCWVLKENLSQFVENWDHLFITRS